MQFTISAVLSAALLGASLASAAALPSGRMFDNVTNDTVVDTSEYATAGTVSSCTGGNFGDCVSSVYCTQQFPLSCHCKNNAKTSCASLCDDGDVDSVATDDCSA